LDERFTRLDADSDGQLNYDEMTETLRAEKDRWDVNQDGRIDLDEWREYVRAFIATRRRMAAEAESASRGPRAPDAPRPPVGDGRQSGPMAQHSPMRTPARAGKLPSNLPTWFKEYDSDADGQVAMYEWKDRRKTIKEFLDCDLNVDGLITVEELIRAGQFLTGMPKPPTTVNTLRAAVGEFFYFEVTGSDRGTVWGTDVYTSDSPIAKAAVHAGLLEVGQTALIKVTILPGQDSYIGSERNGVTTSGYGKYGGSYTVGTIP
jgi:Ca2+-binding EF-hand superfamily protein